MGSEKSAAAIAFASAREADRRCAGVAAAARIVRDLAEAGATDIRLRLGGKAPLAPATRADIERLRGPAGVRIVQAPNAVTDVRAPSSRDIVRRTAKAGDGLVSRWLNRPVSQRLTLVLLSIPGIRPIHATAANALVALIMFAALLIGGGPGLVLGGILFHAASVLDGVDGEIARATFRASRAGAALDSAIDMTTTVFFILGLIVNLSLRDGGGIVWIGTWGLGLFMLGTMLIGWRVRSGGAPLTFDLVKRRGGIGPVEALLRFATIVSSRDFFALLFMLLLLAGLERAVLWIFAAAATIWLPMVLLHLCAAPGRAFRRAA